MSNILKIGDAVNWRGNSGENEPQETKVYKITVGYEGKKWGAETVKEVDWSIVADGQRVIVLLYNGYWAYGHQLDQIK